MFPGFVVLQIFCNQATSAHFHISTCCCRYLFWINPSANVTPVPQPYLHNPSVSQLLNCINRIPYYFLEWVGRHKCFVKGKVWPPGPILDSSTLWQGVRSHSLCEDSPSEWEIGFVWSDWVSLSQIVSTYDILSGSLSPSTTRSKNKNHLLPPPNQGHIRPFLCPQGLM